MIQRSATFALNHLLRQQQWAADRLRSFAGRSVEFRLAPLPDLRLVIRDDGLVDTADRSAQTDAADNSGARADADLMVTLKPSALVHFLRRNEEGLRALLREVDLAGQADLAQVMQALLRELEWDFEEDLSRLVGDALANRMANTGRSLLAWQKDAALRLAQNFAEYWTEEHPLIARRDDVARFGADVIRARDEVDALERRLARLERPARR